MQKTKKTALVLGGGGSRGAYEIGVWQALREMGIKIDLVCGTSVGSINGAMIVQDKFDLAVTLWQELDTSMIFDLDLPDKSSAGTSSKTAKDSSETKKSKGSEVNIAGIPLDEAKAYAREILKNGGASTDGLRALLNKYIDEDAVRNSSIEYGLTTVELPSLVPHYLFKEEIPRGKLADYILASSSIAPAVQPHEIDGTEYIDGGFADVVPIQLALDKGAENIIAVNLQAVGILRREKFKEAEKSSDFFKTISCAWDLGNVLVFDQDHARRLIRLGYLDTLKSFDILGGNLYAFPRRVFDKKTLLYAECAAKLFELDPLTIYTRGTFEHALADAIIRYQETFRQKNEKSERFRLPASLESIGKKLSRKTLVLQLAEELRKPTSKQILSSRAASALIREELNAARYISAFLL